MSGASHRVALTLVLVFCAAAHGQANGPTIFVANDGNLAGSVVSFAVNPDGTLSFVDQLDVDTNPVSMALSPNGRFLSVGRAIDAEVQDLKILEIEPDGSLTPRLLTSVPTTPLDQVWITDEIVAITETNLGASSVRTYLFDETVPSLSLIDIQETGSFNSSIAHHPGSQLLYAQDSFALLIYRIRVFPDGQLLLLNTVNTPAYPLDMTHSNDGTLLYGAGGISNGGDKLLAYSIEQQGELLPVPGMPFVSPGNSPAYLAPSADDTLLFVGHGSDATVRSFAIEGDGSLTSLGHSFDVGLQGSIGNIAVLNDLLFVTDDTTALDGISGIYVFSINADGSFVQLGDVYDTFGTAPETIVAWQPSVCVADVNCDGITDESDYAAFVPCLAGPGSPVVEDCEFADVDGDGDADLHDAAAFFALFGL